MWPCGSIACSAELRTFGKVLSHMTIDTVAVDCLTTLYQLYRIQVLMSNGMKGCSVSVNMEGLGWRRPWGVQMCPAIGL